VPAPFARIPGSTSCAIRSAPNRFVSNWLRTESIDSVYSASDCE
jgi:hypothetical protein